MKWMIIFHKNLVHLEINPIIKILLEGRFFAYKNIVLINYVTIKPLKNMYYLNIALLKNIEFGSLKKSNFVFIR